MKKGFFLLMAIGVAFACTKEKFSGDYSFWYNSQTSLDLESYGITTLTMKVNGMVVGTQDAYKHYTKEPECGTGSFVYNTSMFKKQNKTLKYEVFDQSDSLIWSGTFMMQQGKCGSLQLQ